MIVVGWLQRWRLILKVACAICCLSTNFCDTVASTWTVYVQPARRRIRNSKQLRSLPQKLKNTLPPSIYTTDKNVRTSTKQIKGQTYDAVASTWTVYVQVGEKKHSQRELKNSLPSSIYTTDKNVRSSIIQIKGQLTCHSSHPAARSQMSVYTCYLVSIKTLVWHICVDLNGICSSRRAEALATRIISGL